MSARRGDPDLDIKGTPIHYAIVCSPSPQKRNVRQPYWTAYDSLKIAHTMHPVPPGGLSGKEIGRQSVVTILRRKRCAMHLLLVLGNPTEKRVWVKKWLQDRNASSPHVIAPRTEVVSPRR